jgi:hypothetical protein
MHRENPSLEKVKYPKFLAPIRPSLPLPEDGGCLGSQPALANLSHPHPNLSREREEHVEAI